MDLIGVFSPISFSLDLQPGLLRAFTGFEGLIGRDDFNLPANSSTLVFSVVEIRFEYCLMYRLSSPLLFSEARDLNSTLP